MDINENPVNENNESVKPEEVTPEVNAPKGPDLYKKLLFKDRKVRELSKQVQELSEKIKSYDSNKEIYRDNPLKLLEAYNLSLSDLAQHAISNGTKPEPTAEDKTQELHQKIEKLQRDFEEKELAKQREQEQTVYNEEVQKYYNSLLEHVKANEEKYSLISADIENNLQLLLNNAVNYFLQTNEIPSIEVLLDSFEKELSDSLSLYLKSGKVKKLLEDMNMKESENITPQQTLSQEQRMQKLVETLNSNWEGGEINKTNAPVEENDLVEIYKQYKKNKENIF